MAWIIDLREKQLLLATNRLKVNTSQAQQFVGCKWQMADLPPSSSQNIYWALFEQSTQWVLSKEKDSIMGRAGNWWFHLLRIPGDFYNMESEPYPDIPPSLFLACDF